MAFASRPARGKRRRFYFIFKDDKSSSRGPTVHWRSRRRLSRKDDRTTDFSAEDAPRNHANGVFKGQVCVAIAPPRATGGRDSCLAPPPPPSTSVGPSHFPYSARVLARRPGAAECGGTRRSGHLREKCLR